MTDLDVLLRTALAEAVEPAPPFARIERRHRARRARRVTTATAAVLAVAAASAIAGPRLGDVAPTSGGEPAPFARFRTDAAAKAGFDRCRDALAATLPSGTTARYLDPAGVERCFHEQGYEAPSREFRESGYLYYPGGDAVVVDESWPQACQPMPLPGDPTAIVLARGDDDGVPWAIATYEGAGGTVCLSWTAQHETFGAGTSTPRFAGAEELDEAGSTLGDTGRPGALRLWARLAAGEYGSTPADPSGTALFWGPVGPEVVRVRITFAGKSHDVATVASPLAPDRRFVAVGLPHEGYALFSDPYEAVLYDAAGREVGRLPEGRR